MAYALRYYKEYGVQDAIVRLEFHKKYAAVEYAPAPIEIGAVLAGIMFRLQGEQDDVTAPILKTSLDISLIDMPELQYGFKTGNYEEFYTPDATEYKVLLYVNDVLEWSGYLTPDSYEEDITAYGTVTLTARDNIGHLQDFEFSEAGDGNGMISVFDLLNKAWEKIESPMTLSIPDEGEVIWPECYGYKPYDVMVNVEALYGKDWLECIESVMDSLGMALRYVGGNKCVVVPLRALHLLGENSASAVEGQPILFEDAGHRTLLPACKMIVDVLKYEKGNIYEFNLLDRDYSRITLPINSGNVETWEPGEGSQWFRTGSIGMLNPYEFGKNPRGGASFSDPANMFVSVLNAVDKDTALALDRSFMAGEQMVNIEFTFDGRFYSGDYSDRYISIGSAKQQAVTIWYSLHCYTCIDGVCGKFWFDMEKNEFINFATTPEETLASAKVAYGQSATQGRYGEQSAKVEHSVRVPEGTTTMQIRFHGFTAELQEAGAVVRPANTPIQNLINAGRAYCRITDLVVSQKEAGNYNEMKVTSIYDESYNKMISRSPAFGPGPVVLSAKVIKNGLYLPESGYPPAQPWSWPGEDTMTLQILIHQQILLYHSKPSGQLSGTLVSDSELLRIPSMWLYNGRRHILINGSLNLLTGYLEDVKLREFVDWSEIYPEQYKLMTEDNYDVLTEDGSTVIIGQ